MKKCFWIITLILIAHLSLTQASAQNKIVIASLGFDHPTAQVAAKALPEAYKKLGYDIEIEIFPPIRAVHTFDTGEVDAYLFSESKWAKEHPNGVMVKTPIGYDDQVVFSKKADFTVNGWQSLKPYSIGYQRGMSIVENNVKNMKSDMSENPPQAFQKLDAGRVDIVVMPIGVGLMMIKRLNLKGIKILRPPLEKVRLYHFVHKKHAGLADKLSKELDDMQKSGRLKEISDQVEAEFLK